MIKPRITLTVKQRDDTWYGLIPVCVCVCVCLHSSLVRWHLCCWGRPALPLVCSVSGPAVWSCLYCSHSGSRYEPSNHRTWDTHTQTCYWYLTFLLNQKNTPKTTTSTGHWFLFKVVRQQVSFFSHRWGNMWARGHSDCESQQDDMLGLSQEIWSDINITLLLNEI